MIEKAYKKLRLDALVIQQGRLVENTKSVNKEDLLSMVGCLPVAGGSAGGWLGLRRWLAAGWGHCHWLGAGAAMLLGLHAPPALAAAGRRCAGGLVPRLLTAALHPPPAARRCGTAPSASSPQRPPTSQMRTWMR